MNDLAADYDKLAYGSGTEFLVFAGFSAQRRTGSRRALTRAI